MPDKWWSSALWGEDDLSARRGGPGGRRASMGGGRSRELMAFFFQKSPCWLGLLFIEGGKSSVSRRAILFHLEKSQHRRSHFCGA